MNKIDTGIAELLAKQPSDSAEKDAYIAELQKTVRLLTDEVRNMDELLALLRKKQFAPSSEQTKPTEEESMILFKNMWNILMERPTYPPDVKIGTKKFSKKAKK